MNLLESNLMSFGMIQSSTKNLAMDLFNLHLLILKYLRFMILLALKFIQAELKSFNIQILTLKILRLTCLHHSLLFQEQLEVNFKAHSIQVAELNLVISVL